MAKGEEMEKKAEKKINGWGLFGSKYEDAADLYDKATNFYKLAKSCISITIPLFLHKFFISIFFLETSSDYLGGFEIERLHLKSHILSLF